MHLKGYDRWKWHAIPMKYWSELPFGISAPSFLTGQVTYAPKWCICYELEFIYFCIKEVPWLGNTNTEKLLLLYLITVLAPSCFLLFFYCAPWDSPLVLVSIHFLWRYFRFYILVKSSNVSFSRVWHSCVLIMVSACWKMQNCWHNS